MNVSQAVQYVKDNLPASADVDLIVDFIEQSKIGIMKYTVGA